MWIRMTADEIVKSDQSRKRRLYWCAFGCWIAFSILFFLAPSRHYLFPAKQSDGGVLFDGISRRRILPKAMASAVVSGIGVIFAFWRFGVRDKTETLVCPKCENVKAPDGNLRCHCGGEFVDVRTMKWVDHK